MTLLKWKVTPQQGSRSEQVCSAAAIALCIEEPGSDGQWDPSMTEMLHRRQ